MRINTSRVRCSLILLLLVIPLALFAGGSQEESSGEIQVFVSIAPQAYLAEHIGGDRISTEVLVQEGQDPHTFDPTPSTMARLSEADLYLRIGMEFEDALLARISDTAPGLQIIDCRENIELRQIDDDHYEDDHDEDEHHEAGEHHDDEEHHEDEHHHEEGADPHIWMSVRNTIVMAETIFDALVELDPEGEPVFREGYSALIDTLTALDRDLERILEPVKGGSVFVFHPAFGYFTDDYGLRQVAVEVGGNEPSARQLARVIDEAKNRGARVIFAQPQFSSKSAEAVAEAIGGVVIPIDTLARDYIENMKRIATDIEEGLK